MKSSIPLNTLRWLPNRRPSRYSWAPLLIIRTGHTGWWCCSVISKGRALPGQRMHRLWSRILSIRTVVLASCSLLHLLLISNCNLCNWKNIIYQSICKTKRQSELTTPRSKEITEPRSTRLVADYPPMTPVEPSCAQQKTKTGHSVWHRGGLRGGWESTLQSPA